MREIKFKAWHKKRKIMSVVFRLDLNNSQIATKDEGCMPMDDFEMRQYVGFLDKNGKEIYEGDIIKADWHYDQLAQIKSLENFFYDVAEYGLEGNNIEVVGNVYENPELLKIGKEQ